MRFVKALHVNIFPLPLVTKSQAFFSPPPLSHVSILFSQTKRPPFPPHFSCLRPPMTWPRRPRSPPPPPLVEQHTQQTPLSCKRSSKASEMSAALPRPNRRPPSASTASESRPQKRSWEGGRKNRVGLDESGRDRACFSRRATFTLVLTKKDSEVQCEKISASFSERFIFQCACGISFLKSLWKATVWSTSLKKQIDVFRII